MIVVHGPIVQGSQDFMIRRNKVRWDGCRHRLNEPYVRDIFPPDCRLILFCNTIIFCTVLVKQRDYFSPKSFSGGLPGTRQTQQGEKHYRTLGTATVVVPPSCCVLHPKALYSHCSEPMHIVSDPCQNVPARFYGDMFSTLDCQRRDRGRGTQTICHIRIHNTQKGNWTDSPV